MRKVLDKLQTTATASMQLVAYKGKEKTLEITKLKNKQSYSRQKKTMLSSPCEAKSLKFLLQQ